MSPTAPDSEDTGPVDGEWDLAPLLGGVVGRDGSERVEHLIAEAAARATSFVDGGRGRLVDVDADDLGVMLEELAAIRDVLMRAESYASLWWHADTADQARGALMQSTQERIAAIDAELLSFDLEWMALSDERVEALLDATRENPSVPTHHLKRLRDRRRHVLSDSEEQVLAELRVTSRDAWKRQYTELLAGDRVALDGEQVSVNAAFARLQNPDRGVRRDAGAALGVALSSRMPTKAFIFNTLLYEKSVEDRLRSYPHWLASRNLQNETSDASVEALTEAVVSASETARGWHRLKATLLGLDRLADYDRFAPLRADDTRVTYGQARDLVVDTYTRFAPEAGDIVGEFFAGGWIDAFPRPGKTGGAFCHDAAPSVHPYVLLNFEGTRADVLYMAHELGHGLHAALAGGQGVFGLEPTVTIAETASVFGETLVFERLLADATDARSRLDLFAQRLDATMQTLFESIAIHRFEHRVHDHRRRAGELSVDALTEAWSASQAEIYGDSFETTFSHTMWGLYPHFVIYPGYAYAYAYGQLLSLSAFAHYREIGSSFAAELVSMLAAGTSKPPHELAAMIGCDLADPGFWHAGLGFVRDQLQTAEQLAAGGSEQTFRS